METVFKQKKGITLIALVVTIIVLLILAGISISMLAGDNGILQKATDAKINTEKAQIIENAQTDILGQQTENKSASITKEQLVAILNKYFEDTAITSIPDEVSSTSDIPLTTKDEKHTIYLSEIFKGKFSTQNNVVTLGEKYDEFENNNNSLIGKTINYTSANHDSDIQTAGGWIILGKQTTAGKEGIIITTKNPVSTLSIDGTLTEWTGYETKVNNACKTYVGETGTLGIKTATIKEVRSIEMEDINSAIGFLENVNYPITFGGTSNEIAYPNENGNEWVIKGTDSSYSTWDQHPISSYLYYNDNGTYRYNNSYNGNFNFDEIILSKKDNMKYIYANNSSYWVASRAVDKAIGAYFAVAHVASGYVGFDRGNGLCVSGTSGGNNTGNNRTMLLRPVIVLSSETAWNDVKDLIGNYATY